MASKAYPVATAAAADWRDFLALTKPRVLTLVVFTGLCGLLAAPQSIHPVLGFTAVLCIAVYAVRGNVVELFRMGGVRQGWFVRILRRSA